MDRECKCGRRLRAGFRDDLERRGFTILELMVATAVLMLLVVVFASVFSSAQTGLTTLRNSAIRRQNAQTALMTMAGELKAAVAPQGGFYEGADPADRQLPLLINPPTLGMTATTHQRRGRGTVMRRAKRATTPMLNTKTAATQGLHGGRLQGFLVLHRWQQTGEACCHHGFATAGGTNHQQ